MVTSTVSPTRLVQIFSKFFIRCSWTSELCGTGAPVSPSSSPLSSLSLSEESKRGVANVHCLSPFEWCLLCFPEAFAMWGIDFAVSRVITLQLNASTNFQTVFPMINFGVWSRDFERMSAIEGFRSKLAAKFAGKVEENKAVKNTKLCSVFSFCKMTSRCLSSVSYTHLTLPTIYSV